MQKKFIKRNKNSSKGFTLVELLIAISILAISILATFTAVSNNLRGSNFAEDQVVAYYLADEGIEYIRNIRDQNGIKNIAALGSGGAQVPWLKDIAQLSTDPCYGNNGKVCTIDSPNNVVTSYTSVSAVPYLLVDCPSKSGDCSGHSGLYGYKTGWTTTQFQRSVTVNVTSATEAVVSSTVSWTTNGVSKSYTLSEILRAWQ